MHVPMKSEIASIRKKYFQKKNREEIISSAVSTVKQILAMQDVLEKHKREILSVMIWKISEANGRWNTRYFSAGVLSDKDEKLQHEHVVPRKFLIDRLLNNPKSYKSILSEITACIVTKEEHQKLNSSNSSWGRYKQAGIKVWDRLEEKWL